jgi:hypothetical protein
MLDFLFLTMDTAKIPVYLNSLYTYTDPVHSPPVINFLEKKYIYIYAKTSMSFIDMNSLPRYLWKLQVIIMRAMKMSLSSLLAHMNLSAIVVTRNT